MATGISVADVTVGSAGATWMVTVVVLDQTKLSPERLDDRGEPRLDDLFSLSSPNLIDDGSEVLGSPGGAIPLQPDLIVLDQAQVPDEFLLPTGEIDLVAVVAAAAAMPLSDPGYLPEPTQMIVTVVVDGVAAE